MGNQRAVQQQIAGGGDVVSGFVPEIREAEQRKVKRDQYDKAQRKGECCEDQCCRKSAPRLDLSGHRSSLVHRPGSRHTGIKLDLAECAFVAGDVLLQNRHQCFGLLRAQIDALKILYLDLAFALLLQGSEDQKEIPDIDSHLHAVGIGLTILRGVHQLDIGLRWIVHKHSV